MRLNNTNTPYDDVFRTLLNDCPGLIIPVINEVFQEHYGKDARILLLQNEHFIKQPDGAEQERITDSYFMIQERKTKKYHIECQSTSDNSMLIRMFEYDSQIALEQGTVENNTLILRFPYSSILFLRHNEKTPNAMTVQMITPGGSVCYPIPVLKVQAYTLDEIFEKNLLFLIPFYIFSYEKHFKDIENNECKLSALQLEYKSILKRLETLCQNGLINAYTKYTILNMSKKVLEHITAKYQKIKKEVGSIMGGKILQYEAKTIRNEGIQTGIQTGIQQKLTCVVKNMLIRGMPDNDILALTECSQEFLDSIKKDLEI